MAVVEVAVFDQEAARDRPLLAEVVPDSRDGEVVPANRDPRRRRDGERLREPLEIGGDADAEPVAALELDRELAVRVPRLQPSASILDVGERPDSRELAHRRDRFRPRAEAELADALADVAAADEPDLRIEAAADDEP